MTGAVVESPPAHVCPTCGERYPADFVVCPRDATTLRAANEAADPWLGRVLADTYQITEQLGEGGMGRVFAARHLRLRGRRVAIKVLGEEFVREPEIVARFEQEVESASRVTHPHVIEVYDAGRTVEGVHFLVTELLEGEDLGARIDRARRGLPVDLVVTLARQTCLALAAAHALGIVHRDVKPENVFVTEVDGKPFVKVLDFGISKVLRRERKLTRTGAVLGTPAYMSPEQARGGATVDHRADVYGVGATMYTALTGRPPFDDEDAATVLSRLVSEEPPRIGALTSVPAELEVVVQRAMARDPRDRFASALDFEAALGALDGKSGPSLPHAPTIAAATSGAFPPTPSPRGARTALLFYALLLGLFWIAGAATGVAALLRHAHEGHGASQVESLLLLAGVGAVTFALSASVLARTREAWPNSLRVLELLADRRRVLVVALTTYALGVLGVRFAAMFVLREEQARSWLDLGLDVAAFVVSVGVALLVAVVAWLGRALGKLRRR